MILDKQDLNDFEVAVDRYLTTQARDHHEAEEGATQFLSWLCENPQVLVVDRFTDYSPANRLPLYGKIERLAGLDWCPRPALRSRGGEWLLPSFPATDAAAAWEAYSVGQLQALLNDDEVWDRPWDPYNPHYIDDLVDRCILKLPSLGEVLETAKRFVDSPFADKTQFVSPRLWTPNAQREEVGTLLSDTSTLIRSLQSDTSSLADLTWRQLEDVVAELFRAQGYEVHRVDTRPQGGRDVVLRYNVGPTPLFTHVAVEVKHEAVVDRPTVQQALVQNQGFPMLFMVTSGRFTGGVHREANQPQNHMRLRLFDGVGVRDLLNSYGLLD